MVTTLLQVLCRFVCSVWGACLHFVLFIAFLAFMVFVACVAFVPFMACVVFVAFVVIP